MSTGSGAQPNRGLVVTDITPSVDVPNTADDWQRMAQTFDRFQNNVVEPMLERQAKRIGAEEGAAVARGEQDYKPVLGWGSVADAHRAAQEASYQATIRTDMDAREAAIRQLHGMDPAAYEKAASEMVSGFIQGAPPEFAVDVETYARSLTQRGGEAVAGQRANADRQEAAQGLATRASQLHDTMVGMASQPGFTGQEPAYRDAQQEYDGLQQMRADNPWIVYSPEQRTADDDKLEDDVLTSSVTRQAISAYGEAGGGMPGYASGMRFLDQEILNGEAFKDMDPGRRQMLYRDARKQLYDYSAADREQARAQSEQERADRAEHRERVGEWRLNIALGGVTEEQIMARDDLDDGEKAGLVASLRASNRREQADARRLTVDEQRASTEVYNGFKDQADAGTLSDSDLADGVNAGQLTPGQVATLKARRDRGLKPIIDDVMAPFEDAATAPGRRGMRGMEVKRAIAEEAAVTYARSNPNATLNERLAAGKAISERVFGATAAGRPTTDHAAAVDKAAKLRVLAAERARRQGTGSPMSTAEYNRRRTEIHDAH